MSDSDSNQHLVSQLCVWWNYVLFISSLFVANIYLYVTIDQPVQLDVVIVFTEWIDKNLSNFEPTNIEAKLRDEYVSDVIFVVGQNNSLAKLWRVENTDPGLHTSFHLQLGLVEPFGVPLMQRWSTYRAPESPPNAGLSLMTVITIIQS